MSGKIQGLHINFSELTKGIYRFVNSISRIKGLDKTINQLTRLANAMRALQKLGLWKGKSGAKGLSDSVDKAKNSLGGIRGIIDRLVGSSGKLKTNIGQITKMLSVAYLMRIYELFKRIGTAVYDLVKAYAEYKENINLATVAYNGLEEASESLYPFVEKISNAFGLNESEVIRSVGLFKQMANAMGLAQETGDLLSTTLTKMAYDISSLYNISFERSMSVLQASLAGKKLPLLVEMLIENLFNCWEVLLRWLRNRKISRKVLICRFNDGTLVSVGG